MANSFPGSVKTFQSKTSGQVIGLTHLTDLDQEVSAIETVLLNGPLTMGNSTVNTVFSAGSLAITGNVGIGTASPNGKFEVTGTNGSINLNNNGDQVAFTRNGYNYVTASGAAATLQIQASGASGQVTFATAGTERARIDSTGNFGFGANVTVNTSTVFVGNSTVNTVHTSAGLTVGANVTVNATTVFVGNSSVNTAITGTGITLTGNLTASGTVSMGRHFSATVSSTETCELRNVQHLLAHKGIQRWIGFTVIALEVLPG